MEISEIPQQYHEKLILNLIWFYRMIHGFWLKESKLVDYNLGISSLAKRCYLFCYILSNQKEALYFFFFMSTNTLWILMVDIPCRQNKTWKLHFFLWPSAGGKAGAGTAGGACSAALVSFCSERMKGQQSILSAALPWPLLWVGSVIFCCCCCFNGTSWNRLCISLGEAKAHAVTQHFQFPWKQRGCFDILGEVFLVLCGI